MTEIYVARRDGILRAPSGELFRLYGGKTLADGRHEAVIGSPESWAPMTIDLPAEGAGPGPQNTEADPALFHERMETAEAERDKLVQTLTAVVGAFDSHGLFDGVDRETEGWLSTAVTAVLDRLADEAGEGGVPEPVVVSHPADPETPEGRAAIREWAWANDVDVSERGQLPRAVVEAYEQAHA